MQSVESLHGRKRLTLTYKREFLLPDCHELEHESFPALRFRRQHWPFLNLEAAGFWAGDHTGSTGSRALDVDWNYMLVVRASSLLTADLGTSQHPRLREPFLYNKSLSINTCILLALLVWRTLTNTHLCLASDHFVWRRYP